MRMSCNGCRVLRKGCSEDCSLRPCLEWIKSSESQANATLFLAKFYGRAGLINLINAGPESLRPEIFRSLLYEACGRIMNPIYGSVGLLGSSNWQRCQGAVDAVLNGSPIMQMQVPDDQHAAAAAAAAHPIMPLKGCDIRHLTKDSTNVLHGVQTRTLFKHFGGNKSQPDSVLEFTAVEASLANQAQTNGAVEFGSREEESKVWLELSLCLRPHVRTMEEQKVIEISHGDA